MRSLWVRKRFTNCRYNDPPVINFLSVHGTVSGVAGFPHCNPTGLLGPVCRTLTNLGGGVAYSPTFQNLLFQIDYFRDPNFVNSSACVPRFQAYFKLDCDNRLLSLGIIAQDMDVIIREVARDDDKHWTLF
jgi:hypothetical protein